MNYSFPKLLEVLAGGRGLALATVVEAEGSAPQVAGASAIFSEAGLVAGTVGGGLLEARVEAIAREALKDGRARLAPFRLDADPSDMEGAICGGAATVLIDPGVERDREVFAEALEGCRRGRTGLLFAAVRTVEGDVVEVKRHWAVLGPEANGPLADDLPGDVRPVQAGRGEWPRLVKGEKGLTFAELVEPLPRLVIAGAGHVGRALARLGRLLDFHVTVIDDRSEYANRDNVPEADEIVVGEFGPAIAGLPSAAADYYVIVTRGHQKDGEALRAALGKPSAYLGMIGSKTKVETMRREFLRKGWATEKAWAGIRAPIGLAIGSKTVEEIAVSIAAELVLVRGRLKAEGRG
jgi:xanthine dehydrogenase accessory factor